MTIDPKLLDQISKDFGQLSADETGTWAEYIAQRAYNAGRRAGMEAAAGICDRFQARDVGMQPAECAGAIRKAAK